MPLPALDKRSTSLPNGLRVITVRLPHLHTSVATIHVRVGSRFETPELNGISHFLEHMLYRGTPRHTTAHAQALAFESLGGTLDAGTSLDHGSLEISVPPENLEAAFQLMSEVYQEPLYNDVELERGIVREEILESYDEHGKLIASDILLGEVAFGTHPLGFPITGRAEHLGRFDIETLRAHHAGHYVANGTVVTLAGPIDHDSALRFVDQGLGALPRGACPQGAPPPMPGEPRMRYVRHTTSQTAIRVAFRAPGERSPDEPAMDLLLRVLDDGLSTRLYRQLCDEMGLCYDVSASYEAYDDCGLMELAADTEHEKALEVTLQLLDVARKLRDEGPSEAELSRAKARHRWQLMEMFDSVESVATYSGLGELTGLPLTPAQRHDQIEAVSRHDLLEVAQRWIQADSLAIVAVGKLSKDAQQRLQELLHAFR